MKVEPVTLPGRVVRLEPLRLDHAEALAKVGLAPELWQWIPSPVRNAQEMRAYVETALEERSRGVSMPFAIVAQASGEAIGSTRYGNIEPAHRRLEIGWTWLTPAHQRTGANTEAKLLLLTHAFEALGANRVELKTDALNAKSRAAIARIGAVEEGTFRSHMVIPWAGRVRDTVYFSIIRSEWPRAKARLEGMLRPA
jgi:RimJ/RimL family protein N-acetyltransferase